MKIIEINNPNNIIFPLEKEIFENQKVVYHGTWSTFSSMIESKGWIVKYIKSYFIKIPSKSDTEFTFPFQFQRKLGQNFFCIEFNVIVSALETEKTREIDK